MDRHRRRSTTWLAAILAAVLALALAGCGSSGSDGGASSGAGDTGDTTGTVTLTVYSGQHKDLVDALTAAYTAKTGVEFNVRSGEDADLVNQVLTEGDRTGADIYLSEEPGPIGRLADKGLLASVPQSDFAMIDQRLVPSTENWLPYAARVRVIYYNPNLIKVSQLPASILDLTKPKWKGKFAYAPSGAFTSTVSYLISTIGQQKTLEWLKGIKANGINEQSNGKVRDTVEAGQHPFGISNHYYWWRLAQTKGGPQNLTSKIYYFDHPDAGGLILASGAGVLTSSDHKAAAQAFLTWLVSPTGGQAIVGGANANKDGAQFPVAKGVNSQIKGIPPLSSLKAPKADQSTFSDTKEATKLLEEAGIA